MTARSFEERADWLRREVRREQAGAARFHPDLEELAAYAEGGLAASRRAEIQEHLVVCAGCAAFLLDLAQVAAEPFAVSTPAENTARWESLHPRLVEEGLTLPRPAAPAVAAPAAAARPVRASANGWRLWAAGLAAALVVSLGVNGWQWKRADPPGIVVAEETLSVTRSLADAREIPLPGRARGQMLLLHLDPNITEEITGLEVEILTSPAGRPVWSGTLDGTGDRFVVTVPTSFLAPGEYELRLRGRTATGWQDAGRHTFRITDAG